MKYSVWVFAISCKFLVAATSDWEVAYRTAYSAKGNSNSTSEELGLNHGLSLLEVAGQQSANPAWEASHAAVDQTLESLSRSVSMRVLDMAMCLADPSELLTSLRDGLACASEYSCMSFWGVEQILRMLSSQWCVSKYLRTMEESEQKTIRAPYRKFIHTVVAPLWDAIMFATIPFKTGVSTLGQGAANPAFQLRGQALTGLTTSDAANSATVAEPWVDIVPRYNPSSGSFQSPAAPSVLNSVAWMGTAAIPHPYAYIELVDQHKQECEAKNSLPEETWCMMKKVNEVAHIKPKLSALPKVVFEAVKERMNLQREKLETLKTDGMSVLQIIDDPLPLSFVETSTLSDPTNNAAPSPTNGPYQLDMFGQSNVVHMVDPTDPTVLTVKVGMPSIGSSIGTAFYGMAASTRYSSVTPGLAMSLTEPMTNWHALARSNDGSSGYMYLTRGSVGAQYFHMYLPGGYFCYNMEMCFERCQAAPMLCSTKGWESRVVFSGVFDPHNGGMYGYSHAVIGYTSSDAYLGEHRLDLFEMVEKTVILPKNKHDPTSTVNDATARAALNPTAAAADAVYSAYICTDGSDPSSTPSGAVVPCHVTIQGSFFEGLAMFKAAVRKFMYLGLGEGATAPSARNADGTLPAALATHFNQDTTTAGNLLITDLSATATTVLVVSGCSAAAIGLGPLSDIIAAILENEKTLLEIVKFAMPRIAVIMDSAPLAVGPPPVNGQMGLVDQSQALHFMLYGMLAGYGTAGTTGYVAPKHNPIGDLTDCFARTAKGGVYKRIETWTLTADGAPTVGASWVTPVGANPSATTWQDAFSSLAGAPATTLADVPTGGWGNLCVYSPYILPHIRTSNMVLHTYWDSFALGNQYKTEGGNLNETTYPNALKVLYETLRVLDRGTTSQRMFGFNCFDHCLVENPWWWEATPITSAVWDQSPREMWKGIESGLKDSTSSNWESIGLTNRDSSTMFEGGCIGTQMTGSLFGMIQLANHLNPNTLVNGWTHNTAAAAPAQAPSWHGGSR